MRATLTRLLLAGITLMAAIPSAAQTADNSAAAQAKPAAAQPSSAPAAGRGYLSLNAGYQGTTNTFSNTWSYASNLETAAITAAYAVKPALLIDGGGGVRVWRDLALGVAVSRYERSDAAAVSASVPHPFFYNKPRTYQGTTAGPQRTETGVHIQAMWTAAVARNIRASVFGGPSYFNVRQVFVSSLNLADVYPYDSITLANSSTEARSGSRVGFNVGADLTCLLYREIGVGAMVRFSGATVPFTAPDGSALSLKAGGVQAGAGLRVRF